MTAVPTYSVSGTVTASGAPLAGVNFAAPGGGNCAASDAQGNYACTVPQGWSGTVTPSLNGYSFAPTSRNYSSVAANQSAQDYSATVVVGGGAYDVINTYPHDPAAFTQGLTFENGTLYESTGLFGSSSLRQVNLESGAILRIVDVPDEYFAEGMTIFQGKIFQLTWQSQRGFIYDPATFNQIGQFFYSGEGWGLTHDDRHLIMSDGTSQIRFFDPVSFQTVRSIQRS